MGCVLEGNYSGGCVKTNMFLNKYVDKHRFACSFKNGVFLPTDLVWNCILDELYL